MAGERTIIREKFIAQLEKIKVVDGYNFDVGEVYNKIVIWDEIPKEDFPAICCVTGNEKLTWEGTLGYKCVVEMIVQGYIHEHRDEYSPNVEIDKLIDDIRKALRPMEVMYQIQGTIKHMGFSTIETDEGYLSPHALARFRINVTYYDKDVDHST